MGLMTGYYPDEPDLEEAEWERLALPPLPAGKQVTEWEMRAALASLGVWEMPPWLTAYTKIINFDCYTTEDMKDFVVADREQS